MRADGYSADAGDGPDEGFGHLKNGGPTKPMNLNFPYRLDGRGRTQEASQQDYVTQLVEQVLFTTPGERVNMPDFGSGLL